MQFYIIKRNRCFDIGNYFFRITAINKRFKIITGHVNSYPIYFCYFNHAAAGRNSSKLSCFILITEC